MDGVKCSTCRGAGEIEFERGARRVPCVTCSGSGADYKKTLDAALAREAALRQNLEFAQEASVAFAEEADRAQSELLALREELAVTKQVLEETRIARDAEQYANKELREGLAKSQALSVANILMDVVPGLDGMGEEIYAKSVAEVQLLISNLYLKTEELTDISTYNDQLNSKCEDMQQRLTAAEQELAEVSGTLEFNTACWGRERAVMIDKNQTLTADLLACGRHRKAAEQRNAKLMGLLLIITLDDDFPEHWNEAYAIDAALNPAESGASDPSKPPVGSTVLVCGGIKAIVKSHHPDGLVVGAGDGYVVNEWSKP